MCKKVHRALLILNFLISQNCTIISFSQFHNSRLSILENYFRIINPINWNNRKLNYYVCTVWLNNLINGICNISSLLPPIEIIQSAIYIGCCKLENEIFERE